MSELVVGSLKGLAANGFKIEVASGSKVVQPGSVLQVVSAAKTDVFTTASATYTTVTGLTATITPSSATSKILVIAFLNSGNDNNGAHFRLSGGNSGSFVGDAASSRVQSAVSMFPSSTNADTAQMMWASTITFLDSPSTTSPVTYGVETRRGTGGASYLNRSHLDTDSAIFARGASSITLMEVAG